MTRGGPSGRDGEMKGPGRDVSGKRVRQGEVDVTTREKEVGPLRVSKKSRSGTTVREILRKGSEGDLTEVSGVITDGFGEGRRQCPSFTVGEHFLTCIKEPIWCVRPDRTERRGSEVGRSSDRVLCTPTGAREGCTTLRDSQRRPAGLRTPRSVGVSSGVPPSFPSHWGLTCTVGGGV